MSRSFITDAMTATLAGGFGGRGMVTLRVGYAERLALTALRTLLGTTIIQIEPISLNGIGSNGEIGSLFLLILRLENDQLATF